MIGTASKCPACRYASTIASSLAGVISNALRVARPTSPPPCRLFRYTRSLPRYSSVVTSKCIRAHSRKRSGFDGGISPRAAAHPPEFSARSFDGRKKIAQRRLDRVRHHAAFRRSACASARAACHATAARRGPGPQHGRSTFDKRLIESVRRVLIRIRKQCDVDRPDGIEFSRGRPAERPRVLAEQPPST